MPKVSVIMPVYNGERFVADAIQSVLDQNFEDFELICVNDGSTDSSQEIIDSFADPRLKRLSQKNLGQASARNIGIRFSTGDFISFLDQDDIYLPSCIEERLKYFQKFSDAIFVYNDSIIIDEDDHMIESSILRYRIVQPVSGRCFRELFLDGTFIAPSAVMVKKEIFDDIGVFDETLWGADDYDLWLRIAYKNFLYFLSSSLIKYRVHSHNFSKKTLHMEERTALALEKAAENVPDIEKIIGKSALRRRLYQACFDVAYRALTADELDTGRYWLKKAWRWGRRPKSLFLLLVTTACLWPLVGKYYGEKK